VKRRVKKMSPENRKLAAEAMHAVADKLRPKPGPRDYTAAAVDIAANMLATDKN